MKVWNPDEPEVTFTEAAHLGSRTIPIEGNDVSEFIQNERVPVMANSVLFADGRSVGPAREWSQHCRALNVQVMVRGGFHTVEVTKRFYRHASDGAFKWVEQSDEPDRDFYPVFPGRFKA